jgi:hypothetical protein
MAEHTIDIADLNAVTEQFVAEMLRNAVEPFERLGVADHPDLTCVTDFRAYLRRYDAAVADAELEAPRSATRLRLVG